MKITLQKDFTKNLIKRLKDLERKPTIVGWDQTPHYSEMTMAGLAYLHAEGSSKKKIPPRPVLHIAMMFTPLSKSPLKKDLKKYLSNIRSSSAPTKADKVLTNLGTFYQERVQGMFGDPSWLQSNADTTQRVKAKAGLTPDSPLVYTGDLRDNLSVWINGSKVK